MNISAIINTFQSSASFFADDEVELFRKLAQAIVRHSRAVFIDETHGNVAQVEFQSFIYGKDQCEISDLLIITKDVRGQYFRATFWQAKKEQFPRWPGPRGKNNFDFEAQFNQWELLSRRPSIKGIGKFAPHRDVLKKATSPSIGSFGVFYESKGRTEINYSVAEMVASSGVSKHPKMVINEHLSQYSFWGREGGREALVRCDLESFLTALAAFEIGAFIDIKKASGKWLVGYIQRKCTANGIHDFMNVGNLPDIPAGLSDDGDGISVLLITQEGV